MFRACTIQLGYLGIREPSAKNGQGVDNGLRSELLHPGTVRTVLYSSCPAGGGLRIRFPSANASIFLCNAWSIEQPKPPAPASLKLRTTLW